MLSVVRKVAANFRTARSQFRGKASTGSHPATFIVAPKPLCSVYALAVSIAGSPTKWQPNHLSGISSRRLFSSSVNCSSKRNPRRSIHGDPTEEDRLDSDEDFQRILQEQSVRLAEYRAQQSVNEANDTSLETSSQDSVNMDVEADAKEKRRELIAKMVAKHVPLHDTNKAIDMFNTLIYGFVKNDSMENAQEVFAQMNVNDIPPNKTTFNLLAKGFSQHDPPMIEELQNLMNLMAGTIGLDTFAFNSLITSYAAIGRACHPREMFELMRSHDVLEDITTCNILLVNYGRLTDGRGLEFAEDVLLWMKNTGIKPDATTYNAIIDCCKGDLNRAMDFYEASNAAAQAGEISAEPDEKRLSAMIRNFARAKQLDAAQEFLQKFLERYPTYQLTAGNHGSLFHLNVACLQIQQAFDDIDSFLESRRPSVPTAICMPIIASLKQLPEAVLSENAAVLDEWKKKLTRYPTTSLSDSDAEHWRICLLRWRKVYIPTHGRQEAE